GPYLADQLNHLPRPRCPTVSNLEFAYVRTGIVASKTARHAPGDEDGQHPKHAIGGSGCSPMLVSECKNVGGEKAIDAQISPRRGDGFKIVLIVGPGRVCEVAKLGARAIR